MRQGRFYLEFVMETQKKTGGIQLFSPQGEAFDYERVSARTPKFLAAYPPENYAVKIEATDALSVKPGLMRLYEKCIETGKTFNDYGLPAISIANTLVFTAKLIDKEGNVLRQTSALYVIQGQKDFETGETAAYQRLLASLGFGGEVYDNDENGDFRSQSLTGVPVTEPVQPPLQPQPQPQPQEAGVPKEDSNAEFIEPIPQTMLDQITQLARMKNIKYTMPKTKQTARKLLKDLTVA